jgi:hypothetical protein
VRLIYLKLSDVSHFTASWPWSHGSWIYNYLCNQCLSPLMLWVRISIRAMCTTWWDKVCQWLATGRWFSPGPPFSSTNKTDRHNITELISLKVALNTIKQTFQSVLWNRVPVVWWPLRETNDFLKISVFVESCLICLLCDDLVDLEL